MLLLKLFFSANSGYKSRIYIYKMFLIIWYCHTMDLPLLLRAKPLQACCHKLIRISYCICFCSCTDWHTSKNLFERQLFPKHLTFILQKPIIRCKTPTRLGALARIPTIKIMRRCQYTVKFSKTAPRVTRRGWHPYQSVLALSAVFCCGLLTWNADN